MGGVRPLRSGDPTSVGSYKVTGFLGEGGQGSVYLGVSPSGEQVAIKLLHARFADDEQAVRRFRREAEAARRVAEFCTARVLEVGAVDDQPFIVGEYVDGPSLQHQVTKEGPVQGPALMRLAITTATALVAIHGSGVVHRDFKPSNVLLGPDGPRVIDFGIARALDISQSLTTSIVGTPAFMAPEQFLGEASPASDVFAWAGTMIFAATGRGAFGFGPLPVVMHRILNFDADLNGVPPEMAPLLWACLAKDPRRRPTAEQLMRDLIRASTAPPPAPPGARPITGPQAQAPQAQDPQVGSGAQARPFGGTAGGTPQGHGPLPYPASGPVMPFTPGAATEPSRRRAQRRALVSIGAAATALTTGIAVWLVARTQGEDLPSNPTPTSSPVAAAFGTAVTSVADPSAKKGGTLRVVSPYELESVDPGNMYLPDSLNLVRLYGRSLTMFKPAPGAAGAQIVPDLAESLGVPSNGGKTWTYKLRQGVKYQDGTPITSEDVKYAILRSMDPSRNLGSTHFDLMLDLPAGYQGPGKSPSANTDSAIRTPDNRTIVFGLKRPYAAFDDVVQLPETIPVPKAKDTQNTVLASGPYKIESVSADRKKVVLTRNDQWAAATDPNRDPLPDRYEIGFQVADAEQRLRAGTADFGFTTTSVSSEAAVLADAALRKRADVPVTTSVRMLAINPQVAPFDRVDCRRAVVRALNLKNLALVYGTTSARSQLPTSLVPPVVAGGRWRDPNLKAEGDQQAAKQSLAACGKSSGFTTNYVYRDMPAEKRVAEVVQQNLGEIGIEVTLRQVPTAEFHKTYAGNPGFIKQQGIGLIPKSWAPDWPDPDSFLASIADSREITDTYSFNVSVRVKAIDDLMDRARAELDAGKRAALWTEVEQRLADEAVLVPLVWISPLLLRGQNAVNVHVSPVYGNYDLLTMGVR
ncbi:ABC transporter substrate-binding protein [Nonomuraea angiospora]|uniref:ABC transporter substrate-binding protein n=1 Tax=Nonomuraea angiospora TaxID=46172 RepID=UPI00343DB90B